MYIYICIHLYFISRNEDVHKDCKMSMSELQQSLEDRKREIEANKKLSMERFGISRFSYDDNMIEFYTGFPTYTVFIAFYNAVKPTRLRSIYYTPSEELSVRGRPKAMDPFDEIFMFFCGLKCGFLSEAKRFNVHKSSVSREVITWSNYLYFILGGNNIWPSKENVQHYMPQGFKSAYPNTRVIIDCTEIFTERPSSLALASKTFSTYKSHNTWKGLVGTK